MGPRIREDNGRGDLLGQALRANNGKEVVVVWCDRMGRTCIEKELDFRDAFQ